MFNKYFVYILASKRNGMLYIEVTNNLERRVCEHKNNIVKGFTSKYSVHQLVYYEETNDIYAALQREKQLKTCPHENGEMEPQMEVGTHREDQS